MNVSCAAGFHFGARENDPCLDGIEDFVIEARTAILGDDFHGKEGVMVSVVEP